MAHDVDLAGYTFSAMTKIRAVLLNVSRPEFWPHRNGGAVSTSQHVSAISAKKCCSPSGRKSGQLNCSTRRQHALCCVFASCEDASWAARAPPWVDLCETECSTESMHRRCTLRGGDAHMPASMAASNILSQFDGISAGRSGSAQIMHGMAMWLGAAALSQSMCCGGSTGHGGPVCRHADVPMAVVLTLPSHLGFSGGLELYRRSTTAIVHGRPETLSTGSWPETWRSQHASGRYSVFLAPTGPIFDVPTGSGGSRRDVERRLRG